MRMLRDARINLVWEGTSEILRIWMAREALAPYIEQGIAFLQGSPSHKIAAPLYYARMALRSCLPFLHSPLTLRDIRKRICTVGSFYRVVLTKV